jgi:hypothetical protein
MTHVPCRTSRDETLRQPTQPHFIAGQTTRHELPVICKKAAPARPGPHTRRRPRRTLGLRLRAQTRAGLRLSLVVGRTNRPRPKLESFSGYLRVHQSKLLSVQAIARPFNAGAVFGGRSKSSVAPNPSALDQPMTLPPIDAVHHAMREHSDRGGARSLTCRRGPGAACPGSGADRDSSTSRRARQRQTRGRPPTTRPACAPIAADGPPVRRRIEARVQSAVGLCRGLLLDVSDKGVLPDTSDVLAAGPKLPIAAVADWRLGRALARYVGCPRSWR